MWRESERSREGQRRSREGGNLEESKLKGKNGRWTGGRERARERASQRASKSKPPRERERERERIRLDWKREKTRTITSMIMNSFIIRVEGFLRCYTRTSEAGEGELCR